MNVVLPDSIEKKLTPAEAALHLALGLFAADKITLGQAAEIAGMSQPAMLQELGRRKIPIHYGHEELAEDLKTIEALTQG